jgi:DNA-directed RNA polymerase specialized sigma24 family protein
LPGCSTKHTADICAADEALANRARIDPRRARVVELRFLGGWTIEKTAAVMNISPQTVMHGWDFSMRELR